MVLIVNNSLYRSPHSRDVELDLMSDPCNLHSKLPVSPSISPIILPYIAPLYKPLYKPPLRSLIGLYSTYVYDDPLGSEDARIPTGHVPAVRSPLRALNSLGFRVEGLHGICSMDSSRGVYNEFLLQLRCATLNPKSLNRVSVPRECLTRSWQMRGWEAAAT